MLQAVTVHWAEL